MFFWARKQEQALFCTVEPQFCKPEWAAGQLVEYEGKIYRVSRWVERKPILLERGGSVREWQLWGRRVSDRELRKELAGATDRILTDE